MWAVQGLIDIDWTEDKSCLTLWRCVRCVCVRLCVCVSECMRVLKWKWEFSDVGNQTLMPPALTQRRTHHLYCSPHIIGADRLGAELNELFRRRSGKDRRGRRSVMATCTTDRRGHWRRHRRRRRTARRTAPLGRALGAASSHRAAPTSVTGAKRRDRDN